MERNLNPRVIGACLIGFALVAGAYVLSNFGVSNFESQPAAVAVAQPRVAIEVRDEDNNGIEDWRDEFITTAPIVLDQVETAYEPPTTLTGQVGVNLIGNYLSAQTYGPFGREQEELITDAVEVLEQQALDDIYDVPDITVLTEWDEEAILAYANAAALAIMNNDPEANELDILNRATRTNDSDPADFETIARIAASYEAMRDATIAIPVPTLMVKQHLDLINTYHALATDVAAMAEGETDPLVALIRLQRYEDDTTGLRFALQNMYAALEPYAALVEPSDPALLFVTFSSEFNS